jgi:hypothetical protein
MGRVKGIFPNHMSVIAAAEKWASLSGSFAK